MTDPRQAVIDGCRRMNALGLNHGRAGNLSLRHGDGFLVTPTGMAYDDLTPADIVWMDFDGQAQGPRRPSSEWRFHRDVLAARPEAGCVLHVHSRHATAVACHRRDLPPFHYMIAVTGGPTLRCADYATFGTEALSRAALAALDGRKACLLANHGLLVCARDIPAALDLAVEVEELCAQYLLTVQLGPPVLIDDAEMNRVLARFQTYGQQEGEGA